MESLPAYSSIEVAKHATREDAWLIVGGKVLDVSSWLDDHPGGDDILLDHAGMCTNYMNQFKDLRFFENTSCKIITTITSKVK